MIDLYIDNTPVVEVRELQNNITMEYLTSATVSLTLVDSEGLEVSGQTWPVSLAYVEPGVFRTTIVGNLNLVPSEIYTAKIDVVSDEGHRASFNSRAVAKIRRYT